VITNQCVCLDDSVTNFDWLHHKVQATERRTIMHYKSAFLSLFIILLLLVSACSDDSGNKPDNNTNKATGTNLDNTLEQKEEDHVAEKRENIRLVDDESGLKMRVKPTLEGQVICVLPYGERINLLYEEGEEMTIGGKTGVWSRVQWREAKGWLFNRVNYRNY